KPQTLNSLADLPSLFPTEASESLPVNDHKNTYNLVALMMYLVGVEYRHFETHDPLLTENFKRYDQNKNARIIRNLCIIRTALEQKYSQIRSAFFYDLKNLSSLPDLIPTEAVTDLAADGIDLQDTKPDVTNYILKINQEISNRINNVKDLFPEWVCWDYIRPLFLMPNGFKKDGIRAAGEYYNSNRNRYPYQCYMNWDRDDCGNILNSDYKFVQLLYERNGDKFEDKSLVRGAGDQKIDDLYDFISRNQKTLIVVDCENSDPVKLAAVLSSLNAAQKNAIHKIMLFDSDYTTTAWTALCQMGIPSDYDTEHIVVGRIYEHKSQVDMTLAANTCREVYLNQVDSVILVSSDSDYWALIQSLPGIHFLVMLEKAKSGQQIRDALESQGHPYCFIDDFCTGASYAIKTKTLLTEFQSRLDEAVNLNVNTMLEETFHSTWVQMSDREKANFYDRHIKTMRLKISADGQLRIIVGE
ncbi:MAG: NYN domain-containing protein, partial [Lachnospiraceae bacterium]|nr:NYN domain-containing protein [Lachnospiraceae bacterium]